MVNDEDYKVKLKSAVATATASNATTATTAEVGVYLSIPRQAPLFILIFDFIPLQIC